MAEATYKVEDQWIETFTGRRFNPLADEPDFNLEDIAHALSLTVRYNGHCREFYSVAEHAVLVSLIVEKATNDPQLAFEALHHDDTEAYLSDVPAPFKEQLPDYRKFDKALEIKLRSWLGLPGQKSGVIKQADWLALFMEAHTLLPSTGDKFIDPGGYRAMANIMRDKFAINCWIPSDAKYQYVRRHEQLLRALEGVGRGDIGDT